MDGEKRAARAHEVALDRIKRRSIKIGLEQMKQGKVMSTARLRASLREDISNQYKLKRSSWAMSHHNRMARQGWASCCRSSVATIWRG